jgi:hypothetical protein
MLALVAVRAVAGAFSNETASGQLEQRELQRRGNQRMRRFNSDSLGRRKSVVMPS